MLTLAEAAKETGLTKPAIFKAIKNGRISATKDDKGQWIIDPAELFRVYPPAAKKETVETQTGNFGLLLKLKEFETKLEVTEKRLLDKDREIDDLRSQRDHWRVQSEAVTRLLTDGREKEKNQPATSQQQPAQQPATASATPKKSGVWAWLMGTR